MTSTAAPRGTLPITAMKQQLSLAHIRSVISTAGLVEGAWSEDYDGIDMTVRSFAQYDCSVGSSLDVQLKCTSAAGVLDDTHVTWSLKAHGYKKLQEADRFTVGILAVLVIPESVDEWIHQDEERLLSKGCMYYSLASEWDPIPDGQGAKVVKCARSDVLTVDRLLELMHRAAKAKAGLL